MNNCTVQKLRVIGYGSEDQLKVIISLFSPEFEQAIPHHQHRNVQISTSAPQVGYQNKHSTAIH
jgi:hypothetical protein